ncbi:MAG: DoxX family membrane protein [Patescibacteria group bacterium]|nr:DoxX family membrane protein [Patescibacteria group bacterium]
MNLPQGTKLPHHLRFLVFLLRVALGLDFFYLGWSTLWNGSLVPELEKQSFGQLYRFMDTSNAAATAWLHPFSSWAFLLAGICLAVGFLTTLASAAGIALTVIGYLPVVHYANLTLAQFINDGVILILCLLIIIFAKAGQYLGLDAFFHFSRRK